IPPATTEITGPKRAAVNPDSSAPNSFDVPMKILFTAETRPRISSGVTNCTIEPRMITLTLSNAPTRNNKPSDNQSAFDKPKMMVAIPKPVTNQNKKQKCTQSVQCVNKREPDVRNQQAADCRPDNCSNLKNAIVPSHRIRKRIARNERREKRAARRPIECARRSSDEKKQINQRN